jgi:hypothetical protein
MDSNSKEFSGKKTRAFARIAIFFSQKKQLASAKTFAKNALELVVLIGIENC